MDRDEICYLLMNDKIIAVIGGSGFFTRKKAAKPRP